MISVAVENLQNAICDLEVHLDDVCASTLTEEEWACLNKLWCQLQFVIMTYYSKRTEYWSDMYG
jgi:hypothetical protein